VPERRRRRRRRRRLERGTGEGDEAALTALLFREPS
jgi:hypothetical protein